MIPKANLTITEHRVLAHVAQAKTNKDIADALGISPATVKRHIENIRKKLNVINRVAASEIIQRRSQDRKPKPQQATQRLVDSPGLIKTLWNEARAAYVSMAATNLKSRELYARMRLADRGTYYLVLH